MAKLIVITSNDERQEFELSAFNSIGRHPDNTIQILDRIISKEHAHIQRGADGRYMLKDQQSLNGTTIKGERVGEHLLENGDEILMGSTRLVFVHEPEESALQKVTIAPGLTESHIRQKISAASGDFLPERDISREDVLRRDYERLRIGLELSRAVGSAPDLDNLLPKIVDKTFELVGADRGVILLMDENGDLKPSYAKIREGRDDDIVLSKTVTKEVLQSKTAVLSSDATMDDRFSGAHSIIMQGIRSTMTVPLLDGDDILGIMHLDSQIATNAFSEKDLQICTNVASQAANMIKNTQLAEQMHAEEEKRRNMARLIPPSVVDQVMKGELTIEKGGRLSEITMLFSDIRGFTSMSDGRPPQEVVSTLNEYFEVMVEILFKHGGTLDKFVGDEIIGLFGAPIPLEDAAYKAVSCALDMQRSLKELNKTRESEGLQRLEIGIGINTGNVITGAIGSTKALQYTAIGDAMNVASRLVGVAKTGEIIISEHTRKQLGNRIIVDDPFTVKVKGKAAELSVYKAKSKRDTSNKEDWLGGPTNA